MTTKKRLKNIPVLHDEVKERHQIVVTPTVWEKMRLEASRRKMSVSELIEEFGRGINSPTGLSP
jgi:deoxyhypusine synthase